MSAPSVAVRAPIVRTAIVLGLFAATLLGCGGGDGAAGSGSGRRITVAAAVSTTDALDDIAAAFEAAGLGSIDANLDSSGILARQIVEGAPVDVFLSADAVPMAELVDAGLTAAEPIVIARNRIVVVTPPGDPAGVRSLAGLADVDLIALCDPNAPCGRAADRALREAGVEVDEGHVSRGRNARETLRAVTDGGLDAGIVYATDARIAGDRVETIEVPDVAEPMELLAVRISRGDSDEATAASDDRVRTADALLSFLQGPEGRRILTDHGFLPGDRG